MIDRRAIVLGLPLLAVFAFLGVQLRDPKPFGWLLLAGLLVVTGLGVWLRARPTGMSSGAAGMDSTQRHILDARLMDAADRDPLTGLWNRARFERDLAHQLDRCRRYDERAALMVMDVEGVDQVSKVLGHLAGDRVLCALGDVLSTRLRSSDRAARLGADAFAVLLLGVDDDAVGRAATNLTTHMRDAGAAVQDCISPAISVGTALLGNFSGGVDEALEAAARDLVAAKRRGDLPPSRSEPPPLSFEETDDIATLRPVLAAVHARDIYAEMRSRAVVTLARAIASRLGLDETQTSEVEHVALLHDLGMSTVPDAILHKVGPLTRDEQTILLRHPIAGSELILLMPTLAHLAPAVRAEHERWDGGGYPDGLAGDQIPIASRIALVSDAYHAMTSDRPYRRAMSAAAAHDEIRREAGAQFCPYAAAAMFEVHLEVEETAAAARAVERGLVVTDD